jgi:hypothetical protein
MDAGLTSETSVYFIGTTRRSITEGSDHHNQWEGHVEDGLML